MSQVGFIGSVHTQGVARRLLKLAGGETRVWYSDGEPPEEDRDVAVDLTALSECHLIVFNVPLPQVREVARKLGDVISGRHVVVHTVRGVEPSTLKPVSVILQEETPTQRIGFVSGPTRRADLDGGRPCSAVCASLFPEVHEMVEAALVSSRFRLYRSRDLVGAEFAAAYGRIVGLMSGMAKGLKMGASLHGTLFVRGVAEMARFVVAHGGEERTAFGLSGAGNLFVDTFQEGEVDFQMGIALAEEEGLDRAGLEERYGAPAEELFSMMRAFGKFGASRGLDLHLLVGVQAMVAGGLTVEQAVEALMALPVLYE